MSKNRKTIYLRPKRDRDIWKALEGVEEGDISDFLRGLIRDGIKFRGNGQSIAKSPAPSFEVTAPDFSDWAIEKKEVGAEELNDRFDKL